MTSEQPVSTAVDCRGLFDITVFVLQARKASAWKWPGMGWASPLLLPQEGATSPPQLCLFLNSTRSTVLTAGVLSSGYSPRTAPPARLTLCPSPGSEMSGWLGQRSLYWGWSWLWPPWGTASCCGCCSGEGNTTLRCMCSWSTCVWPTWWWHFSRSVY